MASLLNSFDALSSTHISSVLEYDSLLRQGEEFDTDTAKKCN